MIMQDNEKKPALRFKGFTDPWEQRKFGEVVDKYEDPVETPHDGYYRLGIRSHAKGTFHSYVEKGHELETAQMYRVAAGNFIVNITFGWEHAVAITNESDAGKLVSHRFPQYSFHDDMLPEFFKYVIADEDFRHWLWLASPGGAGRNRVLKLDEMLNYEMVLPSKEEQQRIAAIFRNLDTLVTLHQRKYEKLVNIKKSMLDKMFPKNGASVPEIRFKGFTDLWEQRKLGELVEIGDIDHRMPETVADGIPYLMTGDFVGTNELNFDGTKMISEEDYCQLSQKIKPEKGDILFARYASVGAARYVDFTRKFLISYSCAIIKKNKKINSKYLYHFITSGKVQQQIKLEINTGSQANIGIDSMKNHIVVSMPPLEEQTKIADALSNLDHLITLHQRKLEKLQNIKKSCLEKMFV